DDDAEVTGEIWDLHLPHPRMHERPGRAEQDRRPAAAVDLIEDAHAVALDVALFVRMSRAGLLARIGLLFGGGDAHRVSPLVDCRGAVSVVGRATNQLVPYTAIRCQPAKRSCVTRPRRMATSESRRGNRRARCYSRPPVTCCVRRAMPPPQRAPSPSAR